MRLQLAEFLMVGISLFLRATTPGKPCGSRLFDCPWPTSTQDNYVICISLLIHTATVTSSIMKKKITPGIVPNFIRLPEAGSNCPYTGYSRTGLYNLTVPCAANKFAPEVPAKCDKKRGNTRGIWLIPFDALISYIEALPTPRLHPSRQQKG